MNSALAILPVFNESTHIGTLLDRFPTGVCDVLVMDDASTDATPQELQKRKVAVVRHAERSGVGKCLQDGFAYAKEHGYQTIVVLAGNGKDNPQEIPRLLAAIQEGSEYVQGSRFMPGGEWRNLPQHRFAAIKSLSAAWSLAMGRRLTDVTNGFRAYKTSFLDHPEINWRQAWLEKYELEYYLHFYALKLRVPFREVPVSKNYPTKTNYSKIRPGLDWIRIIKPLFDLKLGLKR